VINIIIWIRDTGCYRVPSEQKADSPSQRTYLLSSKTSNMNHQTELPSCCGPEDANVTAFVEATSLISGRDAVEEFLASGLWPLGQQFGFQVERKESRLSKVLVSMSQITAAIRECESEAKFVVHIEDAANELGGRYNIMEHNAYQGLRRRRLNRIFEFTRILC
jgi:hypothetical protein